MASTFYITAGLPAIDSADSPPSGDNKFFITAGLVANDYPSIISGTTCWGHSTGVTEVNTRTFAGHGSGTATITGSGDSEKLVFMPGQYWEFEQVNTGEETITITQNQYEAGDDVTIKYRTGADQAACSAASYSTYTVPVESSGIFQVKLERAA